MRNERKGEQSNMYIYGYHIAICMHAPTGKLHRLKKNLFAVINVKLDLRHFIKLPSLHSQARVCVQSPIQVKLCETDEAHATEKMFHYV